MRSALYVLLVAFVALGAAAAPVIVGRDVSILVPPPEAVAEEFARQVATRRYDRALPDVDPTSGITLINIRLAGERLREEAGEVNHVEGEPGTIRGDRATASAVLQTERAGRVRFTYALQRTSGMWKIVEWTIH